MRIPMCSHRFRIAGLNLERFLNLAQHKGIPLLRVRREDARALICECFSADVAALAALAGEKGWKMEVLAPLGLSALWHQLKKRPGIPAGFALMLVCMLVLSQFVWQVDVHNAGAYRADLVSFLKENGYTTGIPRRRVDAQALEAALTYRYPQMAWFHVYVANTTLVVQCVPGAPLPEAPSDECGDVVAQRGGVIHSIRVFAGTPAVKAGSVVQKGDVLIRGTERGRDEQLSAVHASGVVLARCWDSLTVTMPLYETVSTETGREHQSTRIHTPWFDVPRQPEEPDFLASNLYITQQPLGGVFFPVFVQTITRREVSLENVPRSEQDVRLEAGEAALKQLKTALFGDEIIDKWVDYCMIEGDILAATATAERLVDIGAFAAP